MGGFNDQAFLARLAARDIPDLVHMSRDSIGTYAARGVLVPLGSCFQREGIASADYRKAALDQVRYKGQIYGAPEFTNQITIIVNNDALRKAGVNAADVQTTNWKRLKAANKKLLQVTNGRLTRIGFDPKIPEFFPLWVKWFGKDLISKDGRKAQLNSKEAVAALAYTVGLINDHGGWNRFKAFRDTFDFFGRNNQIAADQLGAFPIESFYYQVLADGAPVELHGQVLHEPQGRPDHDAERERVGDPEGLEEPGSRLQVHQGPPGGRRRGGRSAKERYDLRKRQGRAFTGLYTGNTRADVKIYEDIYQPMGNKDFDDAVALLVRAPRYGFAVPLSPASAEFRQAWMDGINRVLEGRQSPRQALDQAQREAQQAIDKAT